MTFQDMLNAMIDFQSEVIFSYYDYDAEELHNLTEEEAEHLEIKYMYPLNNSALMVEVYGPDDDE